MAINTGPRELHVDQHLTNLAFNYRPQNFIADQIAPVVPVDKQRNTYPVFSRFENFSIEDTRRAPGTQAKKVTRSVGSAFYQAENYALASDIAIEDQANMDEAYRYELDLGKAKYLINKLNLDMEKRVLTLASNTTAVSTVFVCNSAWLTTGGASGQNQGDPITQIFTMKEYLQALIGQEPNSILIGWRAHARLMRNYYARQFIRGLNNGGGVVTRDMLAPMFEVDNYLVTGALWHTQNEAYGYTAGGTSNPLAMPMSLQNPLSDSMILYYAPPAASRDDPSWMYSFRWQNPTLPAPLTIFRHPYDTRSQVETIEAGYYQDERITGVDYAVSLLTNVASGAAGLG
jgi:hypothetical protein